MAEHPTKNQVVLVRHGQTEWSENGRHTGVTDIPLTPTGKRLARLIGGLLWGREFAVVLSSPMKRARRTVELAGLRAQGGGYQIDRDLMEWDYGAYEGITTPDIRAERGDDWTVFKDGVVPGETPGETIDQVAERARRVLERVLPRLDEGDVALVAHGHFLRVLTAVFLRQDPHFGASLQLDAGSVSVLDQEHGVPTIRTWNVTPVAQPGRKPPARLPDEDPAP